MIRAILLGLLMLLLNVYSSRTSILATKRVSLFMVLISFAGLSLEGAAASRVYLTPIGASLGALSIWVLALITLVELKKAKPLILLLFALIEVCLLLFFTVDNYLIFYLVFERTLVPIVILVYLAGGNKEREISGTYILLYTLAASLPLLLMVFYLRDRISLSRLYRSNTIGVMTIDRVIAVIAILLAFLVKLPIYGLHF